MEEFDKN